MAGENPGSTVGSKGTGKNLRALLVVVLFLVAYVPVLNAGFIWDDDAYVSQNLTLRSVEGLRQIWLEPGATPQYYPLVFTSFWLEYHAWGLSPRGYHAINVLLHGICALLVWRLLARLAVPGAWLAAAIFALHPVHVESVAWVTERKNVLSGVFYLSAMLALLRFAGATRDDDCEAQNPPLDWRWYGLASLSFLAALLSKSVTASLPAAFLVIQWWRRGRLPPHLVLSMIPLFVVGATAGLATVWLETELVGAKGGEWSLSAWERLLVAGRALWFYAAKLVWPLDLAFVYPRWKIDGGQLWQSLFPLGVVGVAVLLWWRRTGWGRGPFAGFLLFCGTLFPALGFLDVFPHRFSYVADHFQYLASLGLLIPLAVVLEWALRFIPAKSRVGLRAALLMLLALLTFMQARIYQEPELLWRDTLDKNPESYLANSHMGTIHSERGESRAALAYYREAHRIKPHDPPALNNLAWLLATADDASVRDGVAAVPLAEEAADLTDHKVAVILDTLAASYASAGQYEKAYSTARRGLEVAERAGLRKTARELRSRMRLYRDHRPYISSKPAKATVRTRRQ